MSFSRNLPKYHIRYSQNFIFSSKLSKEIVDLTRIHLQDNIIEIGPGTGSLTKFIALKCHSLIAIENDSALYADLISAFKNHLNIKFVNADFLNYRLPDSYKYKVIGNIPFAITTEILKKLLDSNNPPEDIYLIVQKESAYRLLGSEIHAQNENLFSLRYKPFFYTKVIKYLKKYDFKPSPKVDSVMLHISKRKSVLVENKNKYLDFVTYCMTAWKPNLGLAINDLFTYNQLRDLRKLGINLNNKPSEVNFENWLKLYKYFDSNSPYFKSRLVEGSFNKLNSQQKNLVKSNRTRLAFKGKDRKQKLNKH